MLYCIMTATLPPLTAPTTDNSPHHDYSNGIFGRLVDAYREDPAKFNVGGILYNIGKRHLNMLKGVAKVRDEIAALPATLGTAPSVFLLETLSPTNADVRRIEAEFAALKTETAREAYITSMVKGITKPAPAAVAPRAVAPAPVKPTLPVKPTAPALSLDAQYDALTTQEARQAFLRQHGAAALKRR